MEAGSEEIRRVEKAADQYMKRWFGKEEDVATRRALEVQNS